MCFTITSLNSEPNSKIDEQTRKDPALGPRPLGPADTCLTLTGLFLVKGGVYAIEGEIKNKTPRGHLKVFWVVN